MALALCGAGTDRAPAHQVADELWREQVEEFGRHGQTDFENVEQQGARHLHTVVDGEAVIHARIVDVALPAHRGAWLFEIHTHDHQQVLGQRLGLFLQLAGVLDGLIVIVDRAGADHDHQAVVLAVQHLGDRRAAGLHYVGRLLGRGEPLLQQCRRDERAHGLDAQVIDAGGVEGGCRRLVSGCRCVGHGAPLSRNGWR